MRDPSSTPIELKTILDAIQSLDEHSLLQLNEAVADRIERLRAEAHSAAMGRFDPGDEVEFTDKSGSLVGATVIKINKKTIGVMNQSGQRWNVSPLLLAFASRNNDGTDVDGIIEWVGGIVTLPAYIEADGEKPAYRPEAIMCLDNEGIVLVMEIFEPHEALKQAGATLAAAIEQPKAGSGIPPQRVRVATAELQKALSAQFPELDVVTGATPELDAVIGSMEEYFSEQGPAEALTYLSAGLPPAAIERFFSAAAELYGIKPWKIVPSDACLLGVSVPAHGLEDAVLTIIGQEESSYGFVLFDSLDSYHQYINYADCVQVGLSIRFPKHRALNFIPGSELDKRIRKEIASNQWPVANAQSYPDLFLPEEDHHLRVATVDDLDLIEGLCRALTIVLQDPKAWKQAWTDNREIAEKASLTTYKGAMDVVLTAPYPYQRALKNLYSHDSLMYPLHSLVYAEVDTGSSEPYEHFEALNSAFRESTEGIPFHSSVTVYDLIQDFAYNYFGTTVAHLGVIEFDEILFDIIPRKVGIGPEDAKSVIESTRAFFRFLQDEFQLFSAEACLALLSGDAEQRLSEALSNPANFGMAKSLLGHIEESGFDTSTKAGIDAWMAASGGKIPDHIELSRGMPGMFPDPIEELPHVSTRKVDPKARKKKRKAARKARKRNK